MKFMNILRRVVGNSDSAAESLRALVAGCANQSDLLNRKFDQVIAGLNNQSELLNRKLNRVIEGVFDGSKSRTGGVTRVPDPMQSPPGTAVERMLREAMEQMPLVIAERTYNTYHANYDARVVRNFPGRVFNRDKPCENPAFEALGRLVQGDQVPDQAWDAVLAATLVEAASVSHAAQVFERRSYVERYLSEL